MKTVPGLKIIALVTLTGFISACSSTPKAPAAAPSLGAAIAAPESTPALVETPRGPSLTLDDVLFDFEESSLRPEAGHTIQRAATYLKSNPERNALVEGHTDHTGDEAFNQTLSVQRSNAIKDALISLGVSENRIKTTGLGESQPVADNDTLEGRQANRRVEVIFVESADITQ